MANIGSGAIGKTVIGAGNGVSPTFASIGTNSGLTAHGIVIAENLGAFSATAAGNSGQVLQSGGASADPAYSTATYPSTAGTSGNVITSNGTNFVSQALPAAPGTTLTNHSVALGTGTANLGSVGPSATAGQILQSGGSSADPVYSTSTYPATNAINTLLYASSANVMGALATANNGTLITDSGGVPSISSTLPAAVQGNITSLGTVTSGNINSSAYAAANFIGITSFTPNVGGSPSYSTQSGFYSRIGGMVFFNVRVAFTSGPTGGVVKIFNLPFTANSSIPAQAVSSWRNVGTLAAGSTQIMAVILQNTNTIEIFQYNPTTGVSPGAPQTASDDLLVTGVYFI